MKIIIGGALGRMGKALAAGAAAAGIEVACGVDVAYNGQPCDFPMVTAYDRIDADADVLVDFSRADGLADLLAACTARKLPIVLCTTGYTDAEIAAIHKASEVVPILRSANMSLGINVMQQLVAMAARVLGDGYDVEIVEKHHRMKLDSPSGTALMLYEAAKGVREDTVPVFGRYGRSDKRTSAEIGLHAVRGGTVTGEHEVGFYGPSEEIILTHRAENRTLFAEGALRGAQYLAGKPAGMYSMQDVVAEMLKK